MAIEGVIYRARARITIADVKVASDSGKTKARRYIKL